MARSKKRNGGTLTATVPWPKRLYRRADRFLRDSAGLHHAFLVHKTLRGDYQHIFKPDSVYYVGKSPAAYIKQVNGNSFPEGDIQKWQCFLWNQAVVPMLIVKSTTQIRVYTACTLPSKLSKPGTGDGQIAHILRDAADALTLDRLLAEIEAGDVYGERPELFDRSNAVDGALLRQLKHTAKGLTSTLSGDDEQEKLRFVHRFLTRLLFVCYLIERGMVKGDHFRAGPLTKLRARRGKTEDGYFLRHLLSHISHPGRQRKVLCELFARVKSLFNGSLFSAGIGEEMKRISGPFMAVVNRFLQGHDVASRQLSLDFWAYDFSVIPIELISAIYEDFLGSQGKIDEVAGRGDSQRKTGAYYTPLHLAEMIVDIALENVQTPVHQLRALDPACGSGVFLVCLFNRMAQSLSHAENLDRVRKLKRAERVFSLLRQLCGVDTNEIACHIACFSLYLAALEHLHPVDVEELQDEGKKLPGLLRGVPSDSEQYDSIVHGNFFDPDLSVQGCDFDLIIGNPPWVSRGKQQDEFFLSWLESGNAMVLGPDKQIAHGFMWEAPKYLADDGYACLLLPTAVLTNDHTNEFQSAWFRKHTVDRVVNLSDLSFLLFDNAKRPCVVVRFSSAVPNLDATIPYQTPKTDTRSRRGGPIYIREEDSTSIPLRGLLPAAKKRRAPVVWKSRLWGSGRDRRLIDRLQGLPKLVSLMGTRRKPGLFIKGQGFTPFNPRTTLSAEKIRKKKDPEPPWWGPDMLFLDARSENIDLAVVPRDCDAIAERYPLILWPRNPQLFRGPKLLISQGSKNMKVAFCEFDVLFQHALQAITGSKKDAGLLRFLCVALRSRVVQYYLFHTSANWGTERDKVHFSELLSIPFFLPANAPDPGRAKEIVKDVAAEVKAFEKKCSSTKFMLADRAAEADSLRHSLEPLVREYYDIDRYERMLIDDAAETIIPSSTPTRSGPEIPTLREALREHCKRYGDTLTGMLTKFTRDRKSPFSAVVFPGSPYSIVRIRTAKSAKKTAVVSTPQELSEALARMKRLLQRRRGHFVFCQNLKVFDGDDLYILKPRSRRFWTRTAALNDADEIAAAIITSRKGRR